jgi:Uma2 family endonuclease
MVATAVDYVQEEIVYPDSDGEPMADNTLQFRWIMTIQGGLDALFADDPNVFVAGDLLWYPVEGQPTIRRAPDALVVFGRPKGYRGSYRQWVEDGIPPQVVFEVLSPGNTITDMFNKFEFYDQYGVEEYYLYNPYQNDLRGWHRQDGRLRMIETIDGYVSPRLGVRFDLSGDELQIIRPDGRTFVSYTDLDKQFEQERQRAEQERQRAEQEHQRAEQEHQQAEQERQRADRLAMKLRELGIDPSTLDG